MIKLYLLKRPVSCALEALSKLGEKFQMDLVMSVNKNMVPAGYKAGLVVIRGGKGILDISVAKVDTRVITSSESLNRV